MRRSVLGVAADVVLVLTMSGLVALALWPVYRDAWFVVTAIGGILAGGLVAAVGAWRRWPSWLVLVVGFGVLVVIGVPLAVPDRAWAGILPTGQGLLDLLAGISLGWRQLLTVELPVGTYQALLVPALVLLFATTLLALTIALRARRGELAVIPPVVAFLVALAFGSEQAWLPVPLGLGILLTALAFLVQRRARRRRAAIRALAQAGPTPPGAPGGVAGDVASGVRSVVAGAVLLAVAAVASVGAATVVPVMSPREVLRSSLELPFDPRDYPSPLAGLRRYLQEDRASEVMLRVTGLPEGARVRIATLDAYDGVVYQVGSAAVDAGSGTFVRIPQSVDQSGLDGTPARIGVEVVGYRGVWLPTVGAFSSIDFGGSSSRLEDEFFYNRTTGTAVVLGAVAEGDSYSLDVVLPPSTDRSDLVGVSPGDDPVARVDALPDELALYLEEQVRTLTSPGERLTAALDALARDGYISHGVGADEPPSRSGHGADRLADLVTAPRMIGDAEQYAVAAALMARQLGFPARVVFGFVPVDGVATGQDVTAWIEVDTAQSGWVAIDPVPPQRPIPQEQPEEDSQVAHPPSVVPPPPDRPDAATEQTAPDSDREAPPGMDPVLAALLVALRVLGTVGAVLAVLLAPFALIVLAKARRRRLRRRAPGVVQRIRGGWDEYADAVLDHGFAVPPAATRSELAAVTGRLPARVLAAVTDRAVFAPEQTGPGDADLVWDAVGDLRADLDASVSRWRRLAARISLRSFDTTRRLARFRRDGRSP